LLLELTIMNKSYLSLILISVVGLSACSSTPKSLEYRGSGDSTSSSSEFVSGEKGAKIFSIAQDFLGVPYRYGGADPSGFDCSGLVQFSHRHAGVNVPRTTAAQYKAVHPVTQAELKPGDLIFFRIQRRVSHVGIYAGEGQFIHAPSSGKHVKISSLNGPYWQKRVAKMGRFY